MATSRNATQQLTTSPPAVGQIINELQQDSHTLNKGHMTQSSTTDTLPPVLVNVLTSSPSSQCDRPHATPLATGVGAERRWSRGLLN